MLSSSRGRPVIEDDSSSSEGETPVKRHVSRASGQIALSRLSQQYSVTAQTFSEIEESLRSIARGEESGAEEVQDQSEEDGSEVESGAEESEEDDAATLCPESDIGAQAKDSSSDEGEEPSEEADELVFRRSQRERTSSQRRQLDFHLPSSDLIHEVNLFRRKPNINPGREERGARREGTRSHTRAQTRSQTRDHTSLRVRAEGSQVARSPAYRLRSRNKHKIPVKSGLGLVSWNSLDVPPEELLDDRVPAAKRKRGNVVPSSSEDNSSSGSDSDSDAPTRNKHRKDKNRVECSIVPDNLSFDQIAGVDGFLVQLQEMVIIPLVAPDLFSRLGIVPPRGVLFHGPPGTGKTLLARILASASSRLAGRPVAFFHRNGAECLSKWIGEAEQNLVRLFQAARAAAPSIIFFDEIDGMAPDRSGAGRPPDQSHISLVSTLLSLMDGLEDRGAVVVVGATNRLESLDPALRRPGRFDREFGFSLPDLATRRSILALSSSSVAPELLDRLAAETEGFSGADLKGLCTEAALAALRRTCPALYNTTDPTSRGAYDHVDKLNVREEDFRSAFPARRAKGDDASLPRPLARLLEPALRQLVRDLETTAFLPTDASWLASAQQQHVRLPIATLAFAEDVGRKEMNNLERLDLLRMQRCLLYTLAQRLASIRPSSITILDPATLLTSFQHQTADAVLLQRYRPAQLSGRILLLYDLERLQVLLSEDVLALWLEEWSMAQGSAARLLLLEPSTNLLGGVVRQRLVLSFACISVPERRRFIEQSSQNDLASIMGVADSLAPDEELQEEAEADVTPAWLCSFARASILYHRRIDSHLGS